MAKKHKFIDARRRTFLQGSAVLTATAVEVTRGLSRDGQSASVLFKSQIDLTICIEFLPSL